VTHNAVEHYQISESAGLFEFRRDHAGKVTKRPTSKEAAVSAR
jgi:hypothetical protein